MMRRASRRSSHKRAHKRRRVAPRRLSGGELVVVHAAELLTLQGPNRPRRREEMRNIGIIYDGAVVIDSGRIREVGTTEEILRRYRGRAQVIDASDKVVMPGFVDPHTHVAFAGSRHEEVAMKVAGLTYREIAARGGGILKTVADTRVAPKAELLAATRLRLDGMLRFGTTTAEVKSGYGLTVESELAILQAIQELSRSHPMGIVPTFLGAHAIPTEFSGRTDAYVDLVVDVMIRAVADHSSARFCDVWVEDGYFSAAQARRILTTAKAHGLASKVHADELSDSGGAALAADIGAVSADHLVHASDAGLRAMADRGVVGVLLPGASLASGIPYADARQILDLGVPVALGTDCSPASLNESMPFVLALATHRLGMYPEEAISAATVNAAFAIGLGEQVGSLEPGKSGDLLVLDFNTYGHLGYRISGNPVETVVKAGLVVAKRPGVG